ncbi:MAG: preprotein translocase subunit SecE [Thermomicrobiales bacterium]
MSTQEQAAPKRRSSRSNARRTTNATQRRIQTTAVEEASASTATPSASAAPVSPVTRPRVIEGAERTEQAKAEGVARRERKAAAEAESEKGLVGRVGGRFEPVKNFARDSMAEIRKVNWPDQETTRNLTILVIAVSAVLGIFLGGIDFVLLKIFEAMP